MKVCVIGGGAAGMMCAIMIARKGHEVSLFEKNEKLGKKIYITGKGRCNVTNATVGDDFLKNVPLLRLECTPDVSAVEILNQALENLPL